MFVHFACFLALTATTFAQAPVPEVRGVIHEAGVTTGIAGVEVGLYQFRPNEQNFITSQLVVSGFTDGNGAFSLKPGRLGEFTVSAKKEGYQEAGRMVVLSAEAPMQTTSMTLIRPGSLTGRVIDKDGNPLANFHVYIETASLGYEDKRTTDANGYFTSNNLRPGEYVVHVQPKMQEREELLEYSEAAFKIVEEDVEPSFWPGGLPERESVLPVPVAGGGIANAGTIVIRKVPYYRVHVSLAGECAPNERWIYRVLTEPRELISSPEQFGECRKDFLLTGLRPGSHRLAVWVGRDVKAWGLVPFIITNKNVETTLRLTPSISVSGQVRAVDGRTLAELGSATITLRPEDRLGAFEPVASVNDKGEFTFKAIAWPQQLLSVEVRKTGTYVKEIRYNGLPIRNPSVDMVPGGRIDVVLDSGPATIVGALQGDEIVLLVRDGIDFPMPSRLAPFQFMSGPPNAKGEFAMQVPPGTYRALLLPRRYQDENLTAEDMAGLLVRAEKVTVEANETKTVNVKK